MRSIVSAKDGEIDSMAYVFKFETFGKAVSGDVSISLNANKDDGSFMWGVFWVNSKPDFSSEIELNGVEYNDVYFSFYPEREEPAIYLYPE